MSMTRAQVITAIAYRLGNVRGQDAAIGVELNLTIDRLENAVFHPWFLLSYNNYYEGSAGEWRISIPEDFLMEYEEGALYIENPDESWTELRKTTQDVVKDTVSGTGTPVYYALTNTVFRLFPTPAESFKIEMLYYQKSVVEDEDNPWYVNAAEWVINETAAAMMVARKDARATQFMQLAQRAQMLILHKDEERKNVNQNLVLGGDGLWE